MRLPPVKTLTVNGSTISNNKATNISPDGGGGGIYIADFSNADIKNSTITDNSATFGGGIYGGQNSVVTIDGGKIDTNSAEFGGGIYGGTGSAVYYTVTFDSRGGSEVSKQLVKQGEHAKQPDHPIKSGYTFAGWYTTTNFTDQWDFDHDSVNGNITLHANWIETAPPQAALQLKYDPNGGSGSEYTAPDIYENTLVTVLSNTDDNLNFANAGSTFSHWNTVADGSGASYSAGDTFTITADTTLYAQWTPSLPESLVFSLVRAVDTVPAYQAAPNTWKLHGSGTGPDLYMVDKIIVNTTDTITVAKWAPGILDSDYFATGGTAFTYTNGIPVTANGTYTVYLMNSAGLNAVKAIDITNIRDGISQTDKPYLIIDFPTATALSTSIGGIEAFTLNFMQGGGTKLTRHYELYEDINMNAVVWTPVGTVFSGSLDGNHHDISNLNIDTPAATGAVGLFQQLGSSAHVLNLGLPNVNITGNNRVGAISGIATICQVTSCYSTGTVNGTNWVGGIIGQVQTGGSTTTGSTLIDGCFSSADVTATGGNAGGIAADVSNSTVGAASPVHVVQNCYTTGKVTASGVAGGVIAYLLGNSAGAKTPKIQNCYSTSEVKGGSNGGGILGLLQKMAGYCGKLLRTKSNSHSNQRRAYLPFG